jgi:hypothetical protein
MKIYFLVCISLIVFLSNLFGEVKNGYEKDYVALKMSMQSLQDILRGEGLSAVQRKDIKDRIKLLIDYMAYYQITDTLLRQFRAISPELYNEMDTLKDSRGRIIDVYVKFAPKDEARYQAAGLASFQHALNDSKTCVSEYGVHSVSVRIWIVNKALWVLSHEFGHLKYVVPNLESYVQFYRKKYRKGPSDSVLGHLPDDPSGKMALAFEHRFGQSYGRYLRRASESVASPLVLINPIRRNILQNLNN